MLEQTQAQVNEVVGIMRVNVEKVLERDQKLSELDSRADALQEGGKRFEQQAQKLKRKYWWKNLKMMIILGVIGAVILIIIIGKLNKTFFLHLFSFHESHHSEMILMQYLPIVKISYLAKRYLFRNHRVFHNYMLNTH